MVREREPYISLYKGTEKQSLRTCKLSDLSPVSPGAASLLSDMVQSPQCEGNTEASDLQDLRNKMILVIKSFRSIIE